jgi:predicted secreted protein
MAVTTSAAIADEDGLALVRELLSDSSQIVFLAVVVAALFGAFGGAVAAVAEPRPARDDPQSGKADGTRPQA